MHFMTLYDKKKNKLIVINGKKKCGRTYSGKGHYALKWFSPNTRI